MQQDPRSQSEEMSKRFQSAAQNVLCHIVEAGLTNQKTVCRVAGPPGGRICQPHFINESTTMAAAPCILHPQFRSPQLSIIVGAPLSKYLLHDCD